MEYSNLRIDILPSNFVNSDGTFNLGDALKYCGKIAGICYDEKGYNHVLEESDNKTLGRIERTISNGHHSVYDHVNISFNIQGIPKILAMVLNNEHQYSTSERSLRYTAIKHDDDGIITNIEEELYNKWIDIFNGVIKDKYGYQFNDKKIKKLAQENARYFVTVFVPTEMIYTTTLKQINYIASWFIKYINEADMSNGFQYKLSMAMKDFVYELMRLNVLDERLMRNEKNRGISLFGKDLANKPVYFDNTYSTVYKSSFAYLAQVQRTRPLYYQMELLDNDEFFVPPIIEDNDKLVNDWLKDMTSVSEVYPQGQLITINERGTYEYFIMKCQERLCSAAQLEAMMQTKNTLDKYIVSTKKINEKLATELEKYSHGARCTFPGFVCTEPCHFKEGITLTRKI